MTLKVKVNDHDFQYQQRVSQDGSLAILAQICHELLHWQAEFLRILSQNNKNDLAGHGQWPSSSIPAENIPGCMFSANQVILVQICDELMYGEGEVYGLNDEQADTGNDDVI